MPTIARARLGGATLDPTARNSRPGSRWVIRPPGFGENWANYRTVQQAFAVWWNEPPGDDPHRRNILEPNYREIGIGVARGYGYFFIADFGSR